MNPQILTRYNSKQQFTLENIPVFQSVTPASLKNIDTACILEIEKHYKGKWLPQTLGAMLKRAMVAYKPAIAQLNADYQDYSLKLDALRDKSEKELINNFTIFETQVNEYKRLLEEYSEACQALEIKPPEQDLNDIDAEMKSLRKEIDSL